MAKGLLELKGTIDVEQFWPKGTSDGDTVAVVVDPDGFQFNPDPAHDSFHITHVFDDAVCEGSGTKKVIHNGKVTIRLEDSDSAEMHYIAMVKGSKDFRQYTGETAATKLGELVASVKGTPVPCKVRTLVDQPSDVFDTYGRMIGNIFIYPGGREVNANHWMIENGWGFPAFYNSATAQEIEEVMRHARKAQQAKRGAWAYLTNELIRQTFHLEFRPHGEPDPAADLGPLILPKLFRRMVTWHVKKEAHQFSGSFVHYLAKQKDGWVRMKDFLQDPETKPTAKSHDLSHLVDTHGFLTCGPADIVFFEKPSTLHDSKGRKVTTWWKAPAEKPKKEEEVVAA